MLRPVMAGGKLAAGLCLVLWPGARGGRHGRRCCHRHGLLGLRPCAGELPGLGVGGPRLTGVAGADGATLPGAFPSLDPGLSAFSFAVLSGLPGLSGLSVAPRLGRLGFGGRRSVAVCRRLLVRLHPTAARLVIARGKPGRHGLRGGTTDHADGPVLGSARPRRRIASQTPLVPDEFAGLAAYDYRVARPWRSRSPLSVGLANRVQDRRQGDRAPARQQRHDGHLAQGGGSECAADRSETQPGRARCEPPPMPMAPKTLDLSPNEGATGSAEASRRRWRLICSR